MSTPTPAAPWERQRGETAVAFAAFALYRDMAGQRRLPEVAQQSRKDPSLIRRWSARWSWQDRVGAWDAQRDREWTQEVLHERRAAGRRHLDTAAALSEAALGRLDSLDVNTLTPRELLEYLKAAMEIEARIYGLGDESVSEPRVRILVDARLLPPGARVPDGWELQE